jgi:hypothetical protein
MIYKTKIINNLAECKQLWDKLVDIETLFDNWDFRLAFHNPEYQLNFVVAYHNELPIGLLPLQYNKDKNYLEFFGGSFMNNNRIYTQYDIEAVNNCLIGSLKTKAKLDSLLAKSSYIETLEFMDNTYNLDISGINSLEEFLDKHFSARKRKTFRKILRDFDEIPHTIEFDRWDDLEILMRLNIERFEAESTFSKSTRRDAFRKLVDANLKVVIMSILIEGVPENVNIFVEFNDIFYALTSGTNVNLDHDLRKYSLLKKFEYAILHNFKTIEVGSNDCNWKESWHLTPHPLYMYKNF